MSKTKPSQRKFYKTEFIVTVLSEGPLPDGMGLGEVAYAITDGDCSGAIEQGESKALSPLIAAKGLAIQGSDPSFFGLTPTGEDIE